MPGHRVGVAAELNRFPVKSMLGERPAELYFDHRGAFGDRLWAVRMPDGKYGAGKNTPRFRTIAGLRECAAEYDGEIPVVTFPDGARWRGDDPDVHAALTKQLSRSVTLQREDGISLLDAGPGLVHILTTGAVGYAASLALGSIIDARRFRPTLLLSVPAGQGPVEESWLGGVLTVGTSAFELVERTERCVMVNHDREGLPRDGRILRALATANDMRLGVYAKVVTPGRVRLGDPAILH